MATVGWCIIETARRVIHHAESNKIHPGNKKVNGIPPGNVQVNYPDGYVNKKGAGK